MYPYPYPLPYPEPIPYPTPVNTVIGLSGFSAASAVDITLISICLLILVMGIINAYVCIWRKK